MKNVILLLISTFFLFSYAGEKPTGPSGTLSEPLAEAFVHGRTYQFVISRRSTAFTAPQFQYSGCTTYVPDPYTDDDNDGVPAEKVTATYNNCGPGGVVVSKVSGRMTIKDKDDSVALPLGGFELTYDNYLIESFIDNSSTTVNGSFNATVNSGIVTTSSHITITKSVAGNTSNYSTEYWLDVSGIADDTKNPEKSGSLSMDGYVRVNGIVGTEIADYTLKITSKDLIYKDSCILFYESGSITFVDGDNNTLKLTYDNCSTTWTYNNGKPISPIPIRK